MSICNLRKIFKPESIAVIGAGEKKGSIGLSLMENLMNGGYEGAVYPVNPKYQTVLDKKAYASVTAVDASIDLAVIAAPIAIVPEILRECVTKDVGGAIIISAGGKETGEKGKQIEKEIQDAVKGSELRIIGPNCLGVIAAHSKMNATFARYSPHAGKVAFISQSGAVCTAVLDLASREKMGFSYVVSLGSMLDADFGDIINFLGNDYRVSSIIMYVENLTRFRNFMSAARAVSRVKPIIVYKAGRSKAGAEAASSHTGALTGEDRVYDAAFQRAGVLRVKTFEELFDCAELLAKNIKVKGPGLCIITNAGGPGVMAADALSDYGGEPVRLLPETIEKLDAFLPSHWSRGNPVDIIGDADEERYCKTLEVCMEAEEIDGILVLLAPQSLTHPTRIAKALVDFLKEKKGKPVFTAWMGGLDVQTGRDLFNSTGITTFDTAERAVRAFMDLYRYSVNIEMLQEVPPVLLRRIHFDKTGAEMIIQKALREGRELLTEIESKNLLSSYGIPVNPTETADSEETAVSIARKIGFPAAMKIISPSITHKSDAGGVRLNLRSDADVRSAYRKVMRDARAYDPEARLDGVAIQQMLKRPDYELIIGAKKDPDFGPVILFGMGGVMTEILKDTAIALPPLNRLLARRLIEGTRVYQILKGFRNHPPVDLVLLEEILIRLSQLVTDFVEIEELDMNPLLAAGSSIIAVDARVCVRKSSVAPPRHLVISPYPNQHETHFIHDEIGPLLIRPIRPEDAPLFTELFDSLSPQSVYYRFFSPMKRLNKDMLARFTQVDYDRQIALAAISESEGKDQMLGVARVILEPDPRKAEFAVMVNENFQGKGIGARLLQRCLDLSKEWNIKTIWGIVLAENRQMIKLGKKLGFEVARGEDAGEFKLTLEF